MNERQGKIMAQMLEELNGSVEPPLPRKEPPMRNPEDFPADIREQAETAAWDIAVQAPTTDEDGIAVWIAHVMRDIIAAALMERDRAATETEREACAKIAEAFNTEWPNDAHHIAELIRSQQ
jgi:hypothetical protein